MIGIDCRDIERIIAQELFELFKTPWEFFDSSKTYDVVISTSDEMPRTSAGLVIIYSSKPVDFDGSENIMTCTASHKVLDGLNGTFLQVYGELLSFQGASASLLSSVHDSQTVAIEIKRLSGKIIRVGYDLFSEIAFLLSEGQPVENSLLPTVEVHIALIRNWILCTGIPLVEIPPLPVGYSYFACLTHDIDFVGIRRHKFDHTMWGFVYRGLVGTLISFLSGKAGFNKLIKNWFAVFKLPFVFARLADDFWSQFEKYAKLDGEFHSTFFFIPYGGRSGNRPTDSGGDHQRRSAPYGIADIADQVKHLADLGLEIGLHGIDAWNSLEMGRQERNVITQIVQNEDMGLRMHWLYYDRNSPVILDKAGFNYDASLGYNETVGFKNGTTQVFRPIGSTRLLEIPLTIQDTALFYPRRLGLSDIEADRMCKKLIEIADYYGGVITLSWHDRSLEPERLWGDFYTRLLWENKTRGAWIGSAGQIVNWFRQRRSVVFKDFCLTGDKFKLRINFEKSESGPQMFLRFYIPSRLDAGTALVKEYRKIDIPLTDEEVIEISLNNSEVR